MARPVEDLEAEVLGLSVAERSRLLERLIASLDADPGIRAAWVNEAQRRDDQIRNGSTVPVSGEDALNRIRARLR